MANIKHRLRRRQNGFVQKVDLVDITEEISKVSPNSIEIIDLTVSHPAAANVDPERFADFRQRVFSAFQKTKKQSMALFKLVRLVNHENKEKFSKQEIDSALLQMDDANEIWLSNGLVRLI